MSARELKDLELVRRLSQAFHEVDKVEAMRRPSAARKSAADGAVTELRLELGHRITSGDFTAWNRLGITETSADNGERREAGKGSVYHDRERGRWVAELTVDGKRTRKIHPDQATAEQWLTTARQRLAEGQSADAPTWTVEAWLERCLADLWPVNLSPTTIDMHRNAADRWWIPALGSRRLESVKPGDITAVVSSMTAAGLSPNSVRINTATIGKAMRQAVVDEHVTRNVVSLAQRPKVENVREAKYLTPDQARKVLELAPQDHHHGDAVALSLWLGLRRGEVLGLSWEAINTDAHTATIGAMLVRTPGGVELKGHVKGGRAKVRTVPLPKGAGAVLERRKRRQAEDRLAAGEAWCGGTPGTVGLVFTDGLGDPIRPDNFGRVVKRITAAAGQEVHPHALRHSSATLLASAGVPMKVAQVILGHSSITMTADVYTHVMGDDMTAAAAAMDRALGER